MGLQGIKKAGINEKLSKNERIPDDLDFLIEIYIV